MMGDLLMLFLFALPIVCLLSSIIYCSCILWKVCIKQKKEK